MVSSAQLLGLCVGAGSWACPLPGPKETCPTGKAARGEGDAGISDKNQVLVALPSWTPSYCGLPSVTEKVQVLGTIRSEVQSRAVRAEVFPSALPQVSGLRGASRSLCHGACPKKS